MSGVAFCTRNSRSFKKCCLFAKTNKLLDFSARDDFVARRSCEQRLFRFFIPEFGLFSFFLADGFGVRVEGCVEVIDQALLPQVVNDLTRRVIRSKTFA